MEGVSRLSEGENIATKDEVSDFCILEKEDKIEQFSMKRPDDKASAQVQGILVLSQNVIIADSCNEKLKLFDLNGVYLLSVDSKHYVYGITTVKGNRFATCGTDKKVRLWTLRGMAIVSDDLSYDVDHDSHGIDFNGTYFCVLHFPDKARQEGGVREGDRVWAGHSYGHNDTQYISTV